MKWRETWIDAGTECRWIKEDAEVILKKEKRKNEKKERKKKKMQRLRLRKGNRASELENEILNFLSPCSEQCPIFIHEYKLELPPLLSNLS